MIPFLFDVFDSSYIIKSMSVYMIIVTSIALSSGIFLLSLGVSKLIARLILKNISK